MPLQLSGLFAPVVTPFTAAGDLDREAFEANVRAHLGEGLAGVVTAGSSGEAALLEDEERVALVAWAREACGRGALVIAGVGGESTRATVRRARAAGAAGADLVLVVAPHYYGRRMGDEALGAHYRAVADASPVPVLLYNIPAYAHFALPPALVAVMAEHPNVAGLKDSAGDVAMLGAYVGAMGPGRVLTGHAGTFAEALARGAAGGILAAALFAPGLARGVLEAHARGDAAGAWAGQARLAPLGRDIVAALGPAGLKCAMDLVGLAGGAPRPPLLPCSAGERALVAERLAAAGVRPAAAASAYRSASDA